MIIFINWLSFIGKAINVTSESLKALIPAYNDLKESNKKNQLNDKKDDNK